VNQFSLGPWMVEVPLNRVHCNGKTIQLEPKMMQVLVCLAEAGGEVVKKGDLMRCVWSDTFVTDDALTRVISELRKTFDDDARQPTFIETIPKSGYRLLVPVAISTVETRVAAAPPRAETQKPSMEPEKPTIGSRLGRFIGEHRFHAAILAILVVGMGALFLVLKRPDDSKPLPSAKAKIAVLPFTNLSGDPDQEYFSDGMTEEVITSLSQINPERLGVVARTSAMHYRHTDKTARQIGHELSVDYILEGSVRRSENRVRVTAQLIQVDDQTHLWSGEYDRDLSDVLAVQGQISSAVADAIRVRLWRKAALQTRVDPEAYQLYLKGRYFLDHRETELLRKALANFQQSVQRDPDFARAWASIALSYELLEYVGAISPHESYPYALAAATRAVQLDPESAEAHTALAYVHEHYEWNWVEEDRELAKAMDLDANYELARQWSSYALLQRGNTQQAVLEMRRALELDPVSLRVNLTMETRLERAAMYDEAVSQCQNVIELYPSEAQAHFQLAELYYHKGALTQAAAEYRHGLQLAGSGDLVKEFDSLNRRGGFAKTVAEFNRRQLQDGLRELKRRSARSEYVSPSAYAATFAQLGNREAAMQWLQRAYDEHASIMLELRDPGLDKIRDMPGFEALVHKVGMPDESHTTATVR
jgi:TolB-like protein/DNA-binding winged helix-turn-helix (wHTH) protein/Flp pilus assembly protein TadD